MDINSILGLDDLVASDNVFFAATGITDGEMLKGVRYEGDRIVTNSIPSCARKAGLSGI